MSRCPAILIAATASGQGKTTLTAALARLHARQGRRVRVFKCGPDFLDPGWHALASGQPVYQMDLWMTGEEDVRRRLHTAAMQSDLLIVEGVMGLFDGSPSAADLAEKFGIPVLAVIDASAMAGTFGALAYGLRHYRPELPWAGVLANRVASERHAEMLREGTRDAGDWLGALMRHEHIVLPHRHLGLTLASDMPDALTKLDAAADALSLTPLGLRRAQALQSSGHMQRFFHRLHARHTLGAALLVTRNARLHFIVPSLCRGQQHRTVRRMGLQPRQRELFGTHRLAAFLAAHNQFATRHLVFNHVAPAIA